MQQYQSYTFGWLLSHYLNFAPERKGQLLTYLKALNSGEDSLTAAQRVFGDLDALQREVRRSQPGPFLGYDVRPGHYLEPQVAMLRLTAPEDALIPDHQRSRRGAHSKQTHAVARDRAAAHPAPSH